jgi:hypothetical protein
VALDDAVPPIDPAVLHGKSLVNGVVERVIGDDRGSARKADSAADQLDVWMRLQPLAPAAPGAADAFVGPVV